LVDCQGSGSPPNPDRIYVARADGGALEPVSDTPAPVRGSPSWSSGSESVVFGTEAGEIYTVDRDGANQFALTPGALVGENWTVPTCGPWTRTETTWCG